MGKPDKIISYYSRSQLKNREHVFFSLLSLAPENHNLVSRDKFDRPSRVSLLIISTQISQAKSGADLTWCSKNRLNASSKPCEHYYSSSKGGKC